MLRHYDYASRCHDTPLMPPPPYAAAATPLRVSQLSFSFC